MLSEELAVFDNLKGRLYLIVHADPREAAGLGARTARLDTLVDTAAPAGQLSGNPEPRRARRSHFVSGFTREGFIAAVEKSKEYIRAGDIFQVVLSQRLSVPFRAPGRCVPRAARAESVAVHVLPRYRRPRWSVPRRKSWCASRRGQVTVRPIAGTRPRGATRPKTWRWTADLLADPKERAEHLMLIDLGRNDVGRVSEAGSVEVGERS
jgi:anthranilate synthase component 1